MKKKQLLLQLFLYLILTIGFIFIPIYWITISKGETEYKMWLSGIFYIPMQFGRGNVLSGITLTLLHLIVPAGIIPFLLRLFQK